MKVLQKILMSFVLFFILGGCSKDYFIFDISKSVNMNAKRVNIMNINVKTEVSVKENETISNEVISKMKYETSMITNAEIKDPEKPGEYSYSEEVKEASFSISQEMNKKGENSIDIFFKGGELVADNKKEAAKPEENQPDIETTARATMTNLLKTSDDTAVVKVDEYGNVLEVEANLAVKTRISQAMQMISGVHGIVFEKDKKIKPGDIWLDKKNVPTISGLQILGNPIEFEIHFKRENDQKYEGSKVAVFSSRYSFENEGVEGLFAGIPVYVNISSEQRSTFFFDMRRKTIVKSEIYNKSRITSVEGEIPEEYASSALKASIDIYNEYSSLSKIIQ